MYATVHIDRDSKETCNYCTHKSVFMYPQVCVSVVRKMTIADGLEKCLRKGKGEEVYLSSHCFALLLLQLGAGE